jgi:hypothetical protein
MTEFLETYSPFGDPPEPDRPHSLGQVRIEPDPPRPISPPRPARPPGLTDEQLRAYEERLNVLENTINSQEARLRQAGRITADPAPNWPKCRPIVYFNINDVPEPQRQYVYQAIFAWVVMAVAFLVNWIGCICLVTVSSNAITSPGSKIALASLYFFIVVPLALDLDAVAVYRALQSAPWTFSFLKIFAALVASVVFEFVMFLGLEDSGSVGLISTIELFVGKYVGLGAWGAVVTVLFLAVLSVHVRFITRLWKFYRGTAQTTDTDTEVRRGLTEFVVQTLT